jgi:hypothetical protein
MSRSEKAAERALMERGRQIASGCGTSIDEEVAAYKAMIKRFEYRLKHGPFLGENPEEDRKRLELWGTAHLLGGEERLALMKAAHLNRPGGLDPETGPLHRPGARSSNLKEFKRLVGHFKRG